MIEPPTLTIEAGRAERQYWKDLWSYRELFFFLAWRDVLVRYKQTVLGIGWAVARPLLTTVVFTIVFGKWAKLPSDGVPYPLLVLTASLPWQFFANSLSESSTSLITNTNLITKVYFPRLVLPASSVMVSLLDFLISFVILLCVLFWYQFLPGWQIFTLPLFIIFAFATAIGGGLWLTALNVKYRDFRYIVPFLVQVGLYISPVGFSSSIIPEKWRFVYSLNPMVGVIDGFRWAILGGNIKIYFPGFILSAGITIALLITGVWFFRKTERTFADII